MGGAKAAQPDLRPAPVPIGIGADPISGPPLQAHGISKSFGGNAVLHGVDLTLHAGEVHALLGENGAGKSTLVRILSGIITEFEGRVLVDGVERRFTSVRDAQQAGIAIIHQELNLVPEMTVAENILLGREPRLGGIVINRRTLARNARSLLSRLGLALDTSRKVGRLRIGERQLVEIAKALSLNARILIMDEPTSALSPAECQLLFEVTRQLAAAGVAIVYISHRMDEVALLADRITILRDGRLVASAPASELSEARIISHMVGREVMAKPPPRATERAEIALSVHDLGLRVPLPHGGFKDAIAGVGFELRAGEVLGIGGLLGSGRTEILETIFGSASGERRGEIRVHGRAVAIDSPRDAIRAGIALVTEDRKATGLLLKTSIRENIALPSQPRLSRLGWRQFGRERALAHDAISRLHGRCRADLQLAAELSGGNQQKVVIGKWLATQPRILLLDEPTRGIDVGAKEEIYEFIFGMATQGIAIVVVTSELPELLLLSDRILVMCEGRQTGILARGEATEEAVMRLAAPRGAAVRMNA